MNPTLDVSMAGKCQNYISYDTTSAMGLSATVNNLPMVIA